MKLLSLCAREPSRLQSLGSFVRLSLKLREKWLRENVGGENTHDQMNTLNGYFERMEYYERGEIPPSSKK